jgi:hypothetical protein
MGFIKFFFVFFFTVEGRRIRKPSRKIIEQLANGGPGGRTAARAVGRSRLAEAADRPGTAAGPPDKSAAGWPGTAAAGWPGTSAADRLGTAAESPRHRRGGGRRKASSSNTRAEEDPLYKSVQVPNG